MVMQIFENDRLYRQKEVAPLLGKSESWLERARWAGNGPAFVKVGRSCLYHGAALNEWLDQQARKSTSATASATA